MSNALLELLHAATDAGLDLYLDTAPSGRFTTLSLVLAGITALTALLCAGVTGGLSSAEGRADLATLAALGTRSRLPMIIRRQS